MKKILLVEDDPFLIDIYSTKLKDEGFDVKVAEDGEKAISLCKQYSPDLVLLDIVLPNKDGWEVLREIKNKESPPKVIVLSNLGQKEEVEKGLRLGAEKYLIKSNFTPSEVVKQIKDII